MSVGEGGADVDRLLELMGAVELAAVQLRTNLDGLLSATGEAGVRLAAGVPLVDLYTGTDGPAARAAVIECMNDLHSALMRSRAEYIRLLVDDDGMTVPQVARLVGHPPQLIRRLYQAARSAKDDSVVVVLP